jgi:zinc protease
MIPLRFLRQPLLLLLLLGMFVAACAPPTVVVPDETRPDAAPAPADHLSQPLGLEPEVREGTLPNGLTYYIRRNTEPQNRAELRLVIDAGSILEEDDQQGLAHLLEHMAFNGTERFPELELVNYLERIGMRFGPDLNAYTSFDETVYMLQVPTDDAELLDTGFTVLREWAGSIVLDTDEIDAERGVVLEEWRSGLGAGARIRDQQLPVLLAGSRYAERLPIGLPDVIQNAPADRVRDFYRDWYRPELMAVVAIGDFDPDLIERTIRERFADLQNPPDAPERPEFDVPRHDETLMAVATDPEQTLTVVQVMRKLPSEERMTVGDFREQLIDQLYLQMINARLREITQQPGAPFLGASASQGGFVRPLQPIGMGAAVPEGGVARGLEALLIEAARVRLHGFATGELDRAKANIARSYQRAFEERDQRPSRNFAAQLVSHFLQGGSVPGIEREFALVQELLPGISLDEVDARAEVVAGEDNRVILVAAPEKEGVSPPTESELRAVVRAVDSALIEPYDDGTVGEALLAALPEPGAIVAESLYQDDGIIEWTLGNGVTVVVRQTDFRNDEVLLTAFRAGGTSLAPDGAFRSAEHAAAAVQQGGVGEFSVTDLERFLAGKSVRVGPYISTSEEGLTGQVSPADLETLLQLVHLYFTEPRRDEPAFVSYRERVAALLQNRAANPTTAFSDTLTVVLAQHHPRSYPLTIPELEEVELDEALAFYRDRFSDANDFTFVFVGAIEPLTLAPLVRRYLATLPADTTSVHEARDLGIRPPTGIVERTLRRGLEPQARVTLVFSGELQHVPERFDPLEQSSLYGSEQEEARWERFRLGALADALGIRLREELREELGGVYGVSVSTRPDRPTGTYTFSVGFGTDPDRVDELVDAVFAEIERFQTAGPDEDILTRVIERRRRSEETDLRSNQYWRNTITAAYRYGEAPEKYLYGADLRARLAPSDLRETASRYLSRERFVRVVLLPEAHE